MRDGSRAFLPSKRNIGGIIFPAIAAQSACTISSHSVRSIRAWAHAAVSSASSTNSMPGGSNSRSGALTCGSNALTFAPPFYEVADQFQRSCFPDVVGSGLECEPQYPDLQPFQTSAEPGAKLLQWELALAVVDRRNCPEQARFAPSGMCHVLERAYVLWKA